MSKRGNIVNENLLKSGLPSDIMHSIYQNHTSIGNNPAIPDIYGVPFLYMVVKKAFDEAKETLKEIGTIDDVDGKGPKEVLSQLIILCQKEERPFRDRLEKICLDHLIDMFGIPEDSMEMTLELKDRIEINNEVVNLDPSDGSEEIEFKDVTDAKAIKKDVFKRRILDVLAMGCAMNVSSNINNYKEDISNVNPKLLDLYHKIISLNTYLLFEGEVELTNEDNKQIGTCEVFLGSEENKVKLIAQGTIFPVLLSEAIRGCIELFISHGLPDDKDRAAAILSKSDYLKAEPWDMRIGPGLWKLLENSFNDISLEELPYLLKRISCLEPQKFNFLMKEVFAKTRKGKDLMSILCKKAKHDIEYDKFLDKMDKMNKDKGVITDEFIHEEELCSMKESHGGKKHNGPKDAVAAMKHGEWEKRKDYVGDGFKSSDSTYKNRKNKREKKINKNNYEEFIDEVISEL